MIERRPSAELHSPPDDSRRAAGRAAPLDDAPFSDVWAGAQRLRTDFARASVQALVQGLVRQIRRALAQADVGLTRQADRKAETPNVS
jgi:hypothetical protein